MDKTLVNKNDKKKSLDRGKTDTQITIHLFITFFFVVSFYDKKNALKTWMICILTGYEIFSTTLTFFLSEWQKTNKKQKKIILIKKIFFIF